MSGDQPDVPIVNLTAHDVMLDVQVGPPPEDGEIPAILPVRLPPAGRIARVAERDAESVSLHAESGVVRRVTMPRSRSVSGLPDRVPGVVYLVSRLTAHAARSRPDLVFPHAERRDQDGAILGVQAVGSYLSRWSPGWWVVAARTRLRAVRGRALGLERPWLIALSFAASTALVGAALGVLGDGIVNNKGNASHWWAGGVFAVCGLAFGAVGGWLWWSGKRLQSQYGTAYVIDEIADTWTYEEKRSFLMTMRTWFVRTLTVPGPADLGADWRWPLDEGAHLWSNRVDDLVRAFWATHFNDDHVTANAVFVWAAWPVAVAFGARAVAGRRGLVLQVRQRPSSGRMGNRDTVDWKQSPHAFDLDRSAGQGQQHQGAGASPRTWSAQVTVEPHTRAHGSPSTAVSDTPDPDGNKQELHVLLIRMTTGRWGTLDSEAQSGEPVSLAVASAGSVRLAIEGTQLSATIHEWRWLPDDDGDGYHAWQTYPTLARAATDWLAEICRQFPRHTFLLGMLVPQEVSVGIGIQAARTAPGAWPEHLWPLLWDQPRNRFVIPGIDLGQASLQPRVVR